MRRTQQSGPPEGAIPKCAICNDPAVEFFSYQGKDRAACGIACAELIVAILDEGRVPEQVSLAAAELHAAERRAA